MRASRILLMLLLMQNRGRMTSRQLAEELEVSTRTVLRDAEALIAAGLPVVVHPGRGGGIELAFNYRTRLTGLAVDEAQALGVLLGRPAPELAALGLDRAAARARTKVLESLTASGRAAARTAAEQFRLEAAGGPPDDRVPALAAAVRERRVVRIDARSAHPRTIHPVGLHLGPDGWRVVDAQDPEVPVPLADCGTINVSRHTFGTPDEKIASSSAS